MEAYRFSLTLLSSLLYLSYVINEVSSLEGDNVKPVQKNKYPFIVAIAHKPEYRPPHELTHFCGGTLISKRHVLTATHCLENEKYNQLQVLAKLSDDNWRDREIFEIDSSCTYSSWLSHNNIPEEVFVDTALLKLKVEDTRITPAPYSKLKIYEALLPQSVTLIGFDVSNVGADIPKLVEAPSKILKGADCLQKMRTFSPDYEEFETFDGIICTKTKPWVLISSGDSGGPLLTGNGIVLGVNFATCPSNDLCPPKSKVVNAAARVIHFTEFIESMIDS
ncbi:hypothetical protein QAD02_006304 [Eretmocerus hayati]|uniref:Uncharacterized protein n=1 Tax=Eretmocerus hayati TaxID=131215 RepID=A0ACC2N0W4_9HYME|nr:hypothetical protein QAD02_006304 [Eretmocerus hayati]